MDWYPEIESMTDDGYKNSEIALALNLSDRRIQQIRAAGRMSWSGQFAEVKTKKSIPAEFHSMLEFTPEAFREFFEHFSGYKLSSFAYEMVDEFIKTRNLMVNVPPRHAKSTVMAVWLPIWLLTLDRNEQIIIVSKTASLAVTHARTITFELEFNRPLIEVFGRYAPERTGDTPWKPSRGELLVLGRTKETKSGQLSILARGAGQQILGTEATVVILDDATDRKTSESETERDRHLQWVREEVLSRVQPLGFSTASGRALVIGQRVHLRDMYGELAAMEGVRGEKKGQRLWKVIKYPAILRWPDEDPEQPDPIVLWPEVWTFDELMESYDRLGHDAFERMYQQNPLPDGSQFVKPEWWEGCRDYHRPGYKGEKTGGDDFLPLARVASFDPSPTQENALIVADVLSQRDIFVASILEAKKWVGDARALVAEMERCIATYNLDFMILESSTMTKWFEQEPIYDKLRRQVRFIEHHTGRNKGDENLGVLSLAADIEAGRIRLPYGDVQGKRMSAMFENEANLYGHGFPDDLLMAMWFIKWNYKTLRPRKLTSNPMSTRVKDSWNYIKEARTAAMSEDQRVKQWRRDHSGAA